MQLNKLRALHRHAKDAARRGEVIEAENFYQHAEHYFRVMREQNSLASCRLRWLTPGCFDPSEHAIERQRAVGVHGSLPTAPSRINECENVPACRPGRRWRRWSELEQRHLREL
jgi:Domain of unknown function (DUF4167)